MAFFGANLKRFDISSRFGGLNTYDTPESWVRAVLDGCIDSGLGQGPDTIVLYLPENLLLTASEHMNTIPNELRRSLAIGAQGVSSGDVTHGGNFGAFTTQLPAAALNTMQIDHVIIGHSEERAALFSVMQEFDPEIPQNPEKIQSAQLAVDRIVAHRVLAAIRRGLQVLVCVGETAEERGDGPWGDGQRDRIRTVLTRQLDEVISVIRQHPGHTGCIQAIAYEPRWAIGPGKQPPGPEYIGFVAEVLRDAAQTLPQGTESPPILYGGGLKRENAAAIGRVKALGGGLVALTKFTPPLEFSPSEFASILNLFNDRSVTP